MKTYTPKSDGELLKKALNELRRLRNIHSPSFDGKLGEPSPALIDEIAQHIRGPLIESLVEDAETAFWDCVAEALPNVPGDVNPLTTSFLTDAMRAAIRTWVVKSERDA